MRSSSDEGLAANAQTACEPPAVAAVSALEVVRELAPGCRASVPARMQREGIITSADLAGLDKEDLRELGFTMLERSRLLRWANSGSYEFFAETPTAGELVKGSSSLMVMDNFDFGAPLLQPEMATPEADEAQKLLDEAQRLLDEVEQQADFWCNLVQPNARATHAGPFARPETPTVARFNSFGEEVDDVRENMLEFFDTTSERVVHHYNRMLSRSPGGVLSMEALRHALTRCGLPNFVDKTLDEVVERVHRARPRSSKAVHDKRITLVEFESVLSRLKLAQLLTGAYRMPMDADTLGGRRLELGYKHVNGRLVAIDYTTQATERPKEIERSKFREFFFGHRKRPKGPCEPPTIRWVHMAGLDLTLLLALMVKYSLHPLGVEDVIEQCPTKLDRYGNHYFAILEQLFLADQPPDGQQGYEPVRVHGRHLAIFCGGPPKFDTIITVTEPDHDEKEDWPGGAIRDATGAGEAWVLKLKQRLEATHSRLRERRADFLMHQILDLSCDEYLKVTRAYTTRLSVLEGLPHVSTEGGPSDWLGEVSLAQQQLAVVSRRLRGLQRLIRRVVEDGDLAAGTSAYVGDVRDHIDEAYEESAYLAEKCRTILETSERALERHSHLCRQKADERLNMMVFALTVATAIWAPVQFMAGVYGMNFVDAAGTPTIPELLWPNGYFDFWGLTLAYLVSSCTCAALLYQHLEGKRKEDFAQVGDASMRQRALPAVAPRELAASPDSPRQRRGSGIGGAQGMRMPLLSSTAPAGSPHFEQEAPQFTAASR